MLMVLLVLACRDSDKEFNFGSQHNDTAADISEPTPEPSLEPSAEPSEEPEQSSSPESTPDPIEVGPIGEQHVVMRHGQVGDGFGFRVAGISDINGDGLAEMVLSAPTYVSTEYNTSSGAVAIYHGQATPESEELDAYDALLVAAGPYEYFGQHMTSCDVNQDGQAELFVSAPAHLVGEDMLGAVYRFSLPLTGVVLASQATQTIYGPTHGSSFGSIIACDEDSGLMAISAGYFESEPGLHQAGAAWVYSPADVNGSIESFSQAQFYGDQEGQNLGVGMSFGDVNGDALPDIFIGGGGEGVGGEGSGVVAGFYGPLSGSHFLENADVRYNESEDLDHLGNFVICGSDINNDGYEDCAFSAYWDSSQAARGGLVYLMHGSSSGLPSLQNANARIYGQTDYGYAGISVAFVDDLSNDGQVDIAIGAYGDDVNGQNTPNGAVYIFTHTPQGTEMVSDADFSIYGNGGAFGYHIAGVEDADGDGLSDLLVGAYLEQGGAGYLFSGGE